jgi:hypothetical protein
VSGIGGVIVYQLWIWAIDFCAMWFGGKGTFKKTQTAFAWAMLPTIVALLLSLISYVLFGDELFKSYTPKIDTSQFLTISYWVLGSLEVVLGIWHFVLLVATVAEVQRFSALKSVASLVTGFLILILPIVGLILLM